MTLSFHCRDVWANLESPNILCYGYLLYAISLPMLTISVVIGHFYVATFKHWWLYAGHEQYRGWVYALMLLATLDLMLEARFLQWFHSYEERYQAKVQLLARKDGTLVGVWWLPSWRFRVLNVVFAMWLVAMLSLVWRGIGLVRSRA
jgi:hypothetical protein